MVARFLREGRLALRGDHPYIVLVREIRKRNGTGTPYIVMEYVEGVVLLDRLKAARDRGQTLGLGFLPLARQLAAVLAACHARNIVHRDLKPANIMGVKNDDVVGGELVKLLDFGIAKMFTDDEDGTQTSVGDQQPGTPAYMAPEQCSTLEKDADPAKMDVYAFGLLSTAAGFAVLASAALSAGPRSPLWLISAYALLAIAEPFLFVAGVGSVGRLAPAGYEGRAFGAWYGSIGLGMFGGSLLGLCWDRLSPSSYYGMLALAMIGNAALMARVAGQLDALLSRFARETSPRPTSASPQPASNERKDVMTSALATPSQNPPADSLFPAVQPGRWGLALASLSILLPLPLIVIQRLPLLLRAWSAIFCGLAVLLGGSYLVARLLLSPRPSSPSQR